MRWLFVLAVGAAGCSDDPVDKTAACDLGVARSAVSIENRKVIGVAAPYAADLGLAARDAELAGSIATRRAEAWKIVERVLAPVPLADPALSSATIPAWHTWYGVDDFTRTFKHLYRALTPAQRALRAPIDGEAGLAWNAVALDEVMEWPQQRYDDYLAVMDTAEEVDGLGGVARVGYSQGTMTHLLESYAKQHACRLVADPDPIAADAMREGAPVTERETVDVARCELRTLGPFVAADGDVVVTTSGTGDADVYVRRGAAADTVDYDCRSVRGASDEECVVAGGGAIYVTVFGASAASVDVSIAYRTKDVVDPACLEGEMPRDAVLVKADWRRILDGTLLPVFDTSAARMAGRLAGAKEWNSDGGAAPGPDKIYTMGVPREPSMAEPDPQPIQRYRLAGLHIMTKELDHWTWITLWWSAAPNTDFGEDRPASLVGPWANYKMCVATAYVEGDPDPRGGFTGSLGDALAAVHSGVGGPTWCSNPYIEGGAGNASTNCIGCHQHGGTDTTAEKILETQPKFGVTRVRNNFFTDYLWAIKGGAGDDLSSYIQAEVDYWDAND